MKKSQFESLIREVLRETIRKVDGKYVVYPEKGGKRLGTHSTKKAAEKQLTAIHLNKEAVEIKYTNPNFDAEWEEAVRYPEFNNMGKEQWIRKARVGGPIQYSKIKNVLGNVDLDFESLEEPKKQRFQAALEKGIIEMPIAVKFSNDDYDLVAGNTRLSGLVKNGIDPKIWIVDLSNLRENYVLQDLEDKFDIDLDLHDDGKSLTLSRIVIPKDKRGQGIGSKVMKLITQYADTQNKPIYLTPSKDFGATSTGRLEQFYKQFGFKKKDKSDFSTRETMVREPQTSENFANTTLNERTLNENAAISFLINIIIRLGGAALYYFSDYIIDSLSRLIKPGNTVTLLKRLKKNKQFYKELGELIKKDRTGIYDDFSEKLLSLPSAKKELEKLVKEKNLSVIGVNNIKTDIQHRFRRSFLEAAEAIERQFPQGDQEVEENYADGKVKGKSRPGRVKKAGASCKGSVTDLRAKAKKYGGEKGKMYHWCANMKSGRKK